MAEYLAVSDYYSQSQLKPLARSPAHFRWAIDHPEPSTHDQELGTVFHTAVLEPNKLSSAYWIRPETYENEKGAMSPWNGNSKVCRDWLVAHRDRPVIRKAEEKVIFNMRDAVIAHPAAAGALEHGENEICMFAPDPETGLLMKARGDRLSGNSILDLKACIDASRDGFSKRITEFGYDVQAAWYLDISALVKIPKEFFLFIAVEKEPPHGVAVYPLDAESIAIGRSKYRRWLALLKHCLEVNEWPGYDTGISKPISLTPWHKKQQLELE